MFSNTPECIQMTQDRELAAKVQKSWRVEQDVGATAGVMPADIFSSNHQPPPAPVLVKDLNSNGKHWQPGFHDFSPSTSSASSSGSVSGRSAKGKTSAKDKEEMQIKERLSYMEKSVIKSFPGHGKFKGWVQEYVVSKDTYIVVYEDGDSEELFHHEIKTLVGKTHQTAATASAKSSAKRSIETPTAVRTGAARTSSAPSMPVATFHDSRPRSATTPALAAATNRNAPATAARKYASSSLADLEVWEEARRKTLQSTHIPPEAAAAAQLDQDDDKDVRVAANMLLDAKKSEVSITCGILGSRLVLSSTLSPSTAAAALGPRRGNAKSPRKYARVEPVFGAEYLHYAASLLLLAAQKSEVASDVKSEADSNEIIVG